MFVPETLSKFDVSANDVFINWQVAFAIHMAQKVVVIIELEQWVYQLMVAPVTHL